MLISSWARNEKDPDTDDERGCNRAQQRCDRLGASPASLAIHQNRAQVGRVRSAGDGEAVGPRPCSRALVTCLIIEVRMSHEMMQLATMIRILSGINKRLERRSASRSRQLGSNARCSTQTLNDHSPSLATERPGLNPVTDAINANTSADNSTLRDTDRAPWPTFASFRINIGACAAVANEAQRTFCAHAWGLPACPGRKL